MLAILVYRLKRIVYNLTKGLPLSDKDKIYVDKFVEEMDKKKKKE
ncbi:hypothetical protein ACFLZZ_01195 [Nanoarchaeota archaeon]